MVLGDVATSQSSAATACVADVYDSRFSSRRLFPTEWTPEPLVRSQNFITT